MENGLQVVSKKFDEIEQIYLVEFISSDEKLLIIGKGPEEGEGGLKFIIWDLYNTGKVESEMLNNFPMKTIENLDTRLARTSGNILQIDDNGNVSSVLKKIEKDLDQKKKEEKEKLHKVAGPKLKKSEAKKQNGKKDKSHIINYDENIIFNPIVTDKEPWVIDDYKRISYCLYHNQKGTEVETLQLMVGRSTVQIWHQVQDDSKTEDELPNKGEPFLEYIWTNRISVNQEREETRLRIGEFKYGSNDELHDKLSDFYLKVYWYIRDNSKYTRKAANVKMTDGEITEDNNEILRIEEEFKKINENDEINEKEKEKMKQELIQDKNLKIREKVIKREDIIEKFRAVRHACKALEHLNKRYRSKYLVNNYIRVHEVSQF
jgi:hypothetical protein